MRSFPEVEGIQTFPISAETPVRFRQLIGQVEKQWTPKRCNCGLGGHHLFKVLDWFVLWRIFLSDVELIREELLSNGPQLSNYSFARRVVQQSVRTESLRNRNFFPLRNFHEHLA